MQVSRQVLIPADPGTAVMQVNTCYTGATGLRLLQQYTELVHSDTFGRVFARTSEDNGRTWSAPEPVFTPEQTREGVIRWGEGALFLDESRGVILHFFNYDLYPAGNYSGAVRLRTRLMIRRSTDGGKTFSPPAQLIQQGYDAEHWAEGVIHGQNSIATSFCAPIRTRAGHILFPVQRCPLGSDFEHPFTIPWQAACFRGTWYGSRLEWEVSQFLRISPALSGRGLGEPTVAELADGSLLMVCRGSNHNTRGAPGRKWRAHSRDGGLSWSDPEPFRYNDGEPFFSPASGSRLIRSSRNGRLYWVGNITPENPQGNMPRYPLVIAEVDEGRLALRRETVAVVADRAQGEPESIQFSNFRMYEDRESGEFVLIMAHIGERGGSDLASPAYEYRISPGA